MALGPYARIGPQSFGMRPYRGFAPAKASEPIDSRAEDYKSPGDNSSPAGQTIPAGIGTSSYDGKIIWWSGFTRDSATGRVTASFAMLFKDTIFSDTFSLVKMFADEQLIISNVAPLRQSGQNIRFYNGAQTAVDPLLTARLGATKASAWPGYVYAVFENFDCGPYGNRVPLIRVVLSGSVTQSAATSELSTLTFGAYAEATAENRYSTVDRIKSQHYQMSDADAVPTPSYTYITVIDIKTNTEINRAEVWDAAGTDHRRLEYPVALDGSDYFVCVTDDKSLGSSTPKKLCLVNAFTGEIVTRVVAAEDDFALYSITSVMIANGSATQYLVFCGLEDDTELKSGFGIALVDVTNETISWIANPDTSPIGGPGRVFSIAIGIIESGTVTFFWTEQDRDFYDISGFQSTVKKGVATTSSVTESVFYTEAESGKYPQGVAFDATDDCVVILREDGSCKKLTLAGATVYTSAANAITDLALNTFNYYLDSSSWLNYTARPGYAFSLRYSAYNVYSLDLSDGSIALVIDAEGHVSGYLAPSWLPHRYYDQLHGWYTEGTEFTGKIIKLAQGDLTPNTVDLVDILTAIATYDDRFAASDLAFTGFPGNETSGLRLENDTTLDDLERSVADPFDVKVVESDGVRKYIYPPRDGSFAVTLTLDPEDFVEVGSQTIEKTIGAGEDELAGCSISYYDVDANYKKLEQPYNRPLGIYEITPSEKRRTINTILSLSASQALELATVTTFNSFHNNVGSYAFKLVPGKSHAEPGDITQFDFRGVTTIARIREARLNDDYTQDCLADQYMQYTDATFTGSSITLPDEEEVTLATRLIYLDLPLLSYAHDLGGAGLVQYAQMAGYTGAVTATLYKSTDDGSTFVSQGSRFGIEPVVGIITAISGTPSDPLVVDESNTITVLISGGDTDSLATITETEFDDSVNLAAIGDSGRWVLLRFKTVVAGDGSVTLSYLSWGDKGSEVWVDDLVVGDQFVLLNSDHYTLFRNSTADLNETIYYKAASPVFPLGAVVTAAHAAAGVAEKPYAPTSLQALYYDGGIRYIWDYRSRLAAGFNPDDHGEATLAFELDIMNGGTVLRTLSVSTNEAFWTNAQIAADFGSLPASWTWRVAMISALVGRGYVAEQTSTLNSGAILLVGDEQSGTDQLLLEGDEQSGTDAESFTEIVNG